MKCYQLSFSHNQRLYDKEVTTSLTSYLLKSSWNRYIERNPENN